MKKYLVAGVLLLASVITTQAQDLRRHELYVINKTSSTILRFYARNLQTDRLYGDLLGNSVIDPGQAHKFDLNDGTGSCNWRIQADLEDGREMRKNINVCELRSFSVTN